VRRAVAVLVVALAGCSFLPDEDRPLPRATLETRVSDVHALAFSPDGVLFASAGGSGAAD